MSRLAIFLGAGNAALAILLGAFGAHALRESMTVKMLATFNTAVDYHLYHALGLIIVGLLIGQHPDRRLLNASLIVMLAGMIIFCGSLYALSLSGMSGLGIITPFGGIAFIAAWVLVLIAYLKQPGSNK